MTVTPSVQALKSFLESMPIDSGVDGGGPCSAGGATVNVRSQACPLPPSELSLPSASLAPWSYHAFVAHPGAVLTVTPECSGLIAAAILCRVLRPAEGPTLVVMEATPGGKATLRLETRPDVQMSDVAVLRAGEVCLHLTRPGVNPLSDSALPTGFLPLIGIDEDCERPDGVAFGAFGLECPLGALSLVSVLLSVWHFRLSGAELRFLPADVARGVQDGSAALAIDVL